MVAEVANTTSRRVMGMDRRPMDSGRARGLHAEAALGLPSGFKLGALVPGTRWVVRGVLGRGGMAVVVDVVKEPGIEGAMKVMHPELARRREFVERFLDEGRLLASLRHPNIVGVMDFGTLTDGVPFLVMERLRGRTLRESLRRARGAGRPFTARNAFDMISGVCAGLERLHRQEPAVVHRDVKPENIFMHEVEGLVGKVCFKVVDFGLVGHAGDRFEEVLGTPRYMAPEQLRGERVTEKSDQYAVALVLYEVLAARPPWDVDVSDIDAMMDAHLRRAPARLSRFCPWVPAGVDETLLRALSKKPGDRLRSVDELVEGLRELAGVDDGSSSYDLDANTTDPDLATLANGLNRHDTIEQVMVAPREGRSLEVVPSMPSEDRKSKGPRIEARQESARDDVPTKKVGFGPPLSEDARTPVVDMVAWVGKTRLRTEREETWLPTRASAMATRAAEAAPPSSRGLCDTKAYDVDALRATSLYNEGPRRPEEMAASIAAEKAREKAPADESCRAGYESSPGGPLQPAGLPRWSFWVRVAGTFFGFAAMAALAAVRIDHSDASKGDAFLGRPEPLAAEPSAPARIPIAPMTQEIEVVSPQAPRLGAPAPSTIPSWLREDVPSHGTPRAALVVGPAPGAPSASLRRATTTVPKDKGWVPRVASSATRDDGREMLGPSEFKATF